jgi:hypothetical protein
MGSAMRSLGNGALQLRRMLSLEPPTITRRLYPELLQTGETAFGKQIIDGQHPHEFFMELAAEYAHRIGDAIGYITSRRSAIPHSVPSLFLIAPRPKNCRRRR